MTRKVLEFSERASGYGVCSSGLLLPRIYIHCSKIPQNHFIYVHTSSSFLYLSFLGLPAGRTPPPPPNLSPLPKCPVLSCTGSPLCAWREANLRHLEKAKGPQCEYVGSTVLVETFCSTRQNSATRHSSTYSLRHILTELQRRLNLNFYRMSLHHKAHSNSEGNVFKICNLHRIFIIRVMRLRRMRWGTCITHGR